MEFRRESRVFRCTDIGTRTVIAVRINCVEVSGKDDKGISTKVLSRSEAESQGWFNGPPYAIAEFVFDEDDLEACEPLHVRSDHD
jgi:hypothetical protein